MKKFLLKLILFIVVPAVAALIINPPGDKGPHTLSTFMAAMADKHKRLDSLPMPRILLVGGSNLAFGFNSEALQDSLSVPVVNLGLHAGLGLSFILEEARQSMRSGDVVVLSPEYSIHTGGDLKVEKTASAFYPAAAGYYHSSFYQDFKLYLDYTHSRLEDLLAGNYHRRPHPDDTLNVYSREAFNLYGDDIGHVGKGPAAELKDRGDFNGDYPTVIKAIQQFCAEARAKHVRVVFFYPPYPASEYALQRTKIKAFDAALRSGAVEAPDAPDDFIFSDSLFYDTVYHLGGKGRDQRTAKVIAILKQLRLTSRPAQSPTRPA